jgi:hypothetical protein
MERRQAHHRDRSHNTGTDIALRYCLATKCEEKLMFGEERSYFRYVVLALVGLMFAGFYFL